MTITVVGSSLGDIRSIVGGYNIRSMIRIDPLPNLDEWERAPQVGFRVKIQYKDSFIDKSCQLSELIPLIREALREIEVKQKNRLAEYNKKLTKAAMVEKLEEQISKIKGE